MTIDIQEYRRFIASKINQIRQKAKKALSVKKCCKVVTHPNGMGVLVECRDCEACKKLDKAILESMLLYHSH
jgi:hypothetical protein